MKTVIIASKNPVKIEAARLAFIAMFPSDSFDCIGINVTSDVPEQPMSSAETRTGAHNRLMNAAAVLPDADYHIAFEGGLEEKDAALKSVIWVAVRDRTGLISDTTCASFTLPEKIATLVRGGMTLGDADDLVFGRTNSKQTNGAIGLLTHDALTRTTVYRDGAILALIPYRNPEFYRDQQHPEAA